MAPEELWIFYRVDLEGLLVTLPTARQSSPDSKSLSHFS